MKLLAPIHLLLLLLYTALYLRDNHRWYRLWKCAKSFVEGIICALLSNSEWRSWVKAHDLKFTPYYKHGLLKYKYKWWHNDITRWVKKLFVMWLIHFTRSTLNRMDATLFIPTKVYIFLLYSFPIISNLITLTNQIGLLSITNHLQHHVSVGFFGISRWKPLKEALQYTTTVQSSK